MLSSDSIQAYSPLAVMRQVFDCDLLIFDIQNRGRVIAERAPHSRSRLGEAFFEYLPQAERRKLSEHLRDYRIDPIELDASIGRITLFPALLYHTSLGIALLPHSGKASRDELALWQRWNQQFLSHSFSSEKAPFQPRTHLEELSALLGCPCNCEKETKFPLHTQTEIASFSAFSLVLLLLCRRIGQAREAVTSLSFCESGALFEIHFPCSEALSSDDLAIVWLHQHADRYHFPMECLTNEQTLRFLVVLHHVDLTPPGVKEPFEIQFLQVDEKS